MAMDAVAVAELPRAAPIGSLVVSEHCFLAFTHGNGGAAFFNWMQWFERGSVLGFGFGFFSICCVLWTINKTRHLW